MVWLCSAETGTKKCRDAEAKGVAIVDEEWVRNRIPGGVGSSAGNKATGRTALQKRKQAGSDDGSDEEDGDSDVDDDGNDDDNAATGVHPNVGGAYRQEHKEGTNGGPTLIGSVMSWMGVPWTSRFLRRCACSEIYPNDSGHQLVAPCTSRIRCSHQSLLIPKGG
jgi:hypothetical protein